MPHTPGPWHADWVNVRGPDGAPIADCIPVAKLRPTADSEANARLIASAPTMLAALEHAIDLIATVQRQGCPAGPVAIPGPIADALRKAKGE